MPSHDFSLSFSVDQTPQEVFAAINDVRSWWSGEVEGDTAAPGGEFTYRVPGVHYARQRIIESRPGRKVVWQVTEARLEFAADPQEWKGTQIVFEIAAQGGKTELRFTHKGLSARFECFENCSTAWGMLVNGNLRQRSATGQPQPSPW